MDAAFVGLWIAVGALVLSFVVAVTITAWQFHQLIDTVHDLQIDVQTLRSDVVWLLKEEDKRIRRAGLELIDEQGPKDAA